MTKTPTKYIIAKSVQEVCRAFLSGKESNRYANTKSVGGTLCLHDRLIASWGWENGELILGLSFSGYPSQLTKNRLNTLMEEINGTKPFFTRGGNNYFKTLAREVERDEVLKFPLSTLTNYSPHINKKDATTHAKTKKISDLATARAQR